MRKLRLGAVVFVISLVALPGLAMAKHTQDATGRANLHPLPLSQPEDNGVVPGSLSGVRGTFTFVDDGNNSITISGEAWGLDPDGTYVSLIYDNGSVPGGFFAFGAQGATKGACDPTSEDLEGMMLVGNPNVEDPPNIFWTVDGDGHGTINATNLLDEEQFPGPFTTSTYVSLDDFDTISIRQLELDFAVVACGQVATHPAK